MKKIYVVMGRAGYNAWLVIAFFDEKKAKERVKNATKRAKEIWLTGKIPNIFDNPKLNGDYRHNWDEEAINEYDKNMHMDTSGIEYFYYTVDLEE